VKDGQKVETVYIPDDDRGAVCISTQVGCTLSCSFCHTGTQKLVRNLGAAEIVGQFMAARDSYGEWPTPTDQTRLLSNIVVMGMGEPLYNYEATAKALTILMDHEGVALSRRRITLSTSGVVPMMDKCGAELGVNLAVSLHAVRDELRDVLVPLNRKYPIAELLAACRRYPGATNARRITFEYVMLDGVNDSEAEAHELVRLLAGIPAKVNLIPFNPWPGSPYCHLEARRAAPLRRGAERGRLLLPHPAAARAGHPGRLRPAQDRERAGQAGLSARPPASGRGDGAAASAWRRRIVLATLGLAAAELLLLAASGLLTEAAAALVVLAGTVLWTRVDTSAKERRVRATLTREIKRNLDDALPMLRQLRDDFAGRVIQRLDAGEPLYFAFSADENISLKIFGPMIPGLEPELAYAIMEYFDAGESGLRPAAADRG
jgi:pyruvate-formate lyase-activating enzyme